MKINTVILTAMLLAGCGGGKHILVEDRKHTCPAQKPPIDKEKVKHEPKTLQQLKAVAEYRLLGLETWEEGYEGCVGDD